MRGGLAGLVALAGLLAALAAALLWTAGRDLLDADRFAADAVTALRTPEGRAAVAVRVEEGIAAGAPGVPSAAARLAAERATAAALGAPGAAALLEPSVAAAHRRVLRLDGDPAVLSLADARDELARRLAAVDPRLAGALPPAERLEGVPLATGVRAPGVPAARIAARVEEITLALAGAAAALLALALVLSPRPAALARAAGAGLLVLAAVPAIARLAVPAAARASVARPEDADLAGRLSAEVLSPWTAASAALALVGAGLLAAGVAAGRRRPRRGRRR